MCSIGLSCLFNCIRDYGVVSGIQFIIEVQRIDVIKHTWVYTQRTGKKIALCLEIKKSTAMMLEAKYFF